MGSPDIGDGSAYDPLTGRLRPTPPAPADDAGDDAKIDAILADRADADRIRECSKRLREEHRPADDAVRRESASAEAMREAFESWWDGPKDGETMRPFGSGSKAHAWMVWQAARALPLPARPTAAEKHSGAPRPVAESARPAAFPSDTSRQEPGCHSKSGTTGACPDTGAPAPAATTDLDTVGDGGTPMRVQHERLSGPTPPAPADDAGGAKPVAWAVRDRHGQYGEPSRSEAQIRHDCDYLNRDSSTPYYIGQGPYEVVPLAPLPARDDAGGAEAMREAWAYAIVNAQGKRTGVIHADRSRLVPIVEADNDDDLAGGPFRIIPLAPIPARPTTAADAVVEALRDMIDLYALTRGVLCAKCMDRVAAPDDHSVVRSAVAALRRAKGGA